MSHHIKAPPRIEGSSKKWLYIVIGTCLAVWWFVVPNLYRADPLYKALVRGDTNAVARQIGANPPELEFRFLMLDATPLHLAAERGDTNMINLLLSLGADIEAKGYRNSATPLHCAAGHGQKAAVELLLAHGANANALDRDRETPLHEAAWSDNPEVIRLLAEHGGDINAQSLTYSANPPYTPLVEAVKYQRTNACRTLLELGANADFDYLVGIIADQRSGAALASKATRAQWDAIVSILEEFRAKRSIQHGSAAYGSQRSRAETNSTSPDSGSRR